jgi:hypothetical protein
MNGQWHVRPKSAAAGRRQWRRLKAAVVFVALIVLIALIIGWRYSPSRPATYRNIRQHFKYGSIGSDIENGLPLAVMRVLPRMFPQHLPPGSERDWTAFGFIREPGHDMPIGFSRRRRLIDLTGLNCAACHVGVVRSSADDQPRIFLGMPSNTVDLQSFFEFLFACAADPRFTPKDILPEIEKDGRLFILDRIIYQHAIPLMKKGLLRRRDQLATLLTPDHPRFGPGRVDTFNPYKVNQFAEHYPDGIPDGEQYGTVDLPSVWNQRPRQNMQLHWDGNNTSVFERNISAALGAGATRENVDLIKIERLRRWMDDLPAPEFPFTKSETSDSYRRGQQLYLRYCFRCHDFSGPDVGKVVPLIEIGTDPGRWQSYTPKLAKIQKKYGDGYDWGWHHFAKTDGYANQPLDGIWARAPYLHNGAVPTLWHLLQPQQDRPKSFFIGHGVYDAENVGFRLDAEQVGTRKSFQFDTEQNGNSNSGHSGEKYGTELPDDAKRDLIEYLKTL